MTIIGRIDIWHFTSFASTLLLWFLYPSVSKHVGKFYTAVWFTLITYASLVAFMLQVGKHSGYYYAHKLGSAQTVILLTLIPLVVHKGHKYIPDILVGLGVLDAIHLIGGGFGFLTGPSFDTAMLAVFIPFIFIADLQWRWAIVTLYLVAILKVGGTTAFLILAGQGCVHLLRHRWTVLLSLASLLGVGLLTQGTEAWNDNNRLAMWKRYLEIIQKASGWTQLVGSGPGSFEWIGTFIEVNGFKYVWMHNDWLQIFFETGLIGLTLAVIIALHLAWRHRENGLMLSLIVGFSICMCLYSPLRFVYGQLLVCWIILSKDVRVETASSSNK